MQKRIWEAEQKGKEAERHELERAEEVKKMIDVEAQAKMVSFIGADKSAIGGTASHPLHFMYAAPPGMQRDAQKDKAAEPITRAMAGLPGAAAAAAAAALESSADGGDEVAAFMARFASAPAAASAAAAPGRPAAASLPLAPAHPGAGGVAAVVSAGAGRLGGSHAGSAASVLARPPADGPSAAAAATGEGSGEEAAAPPKDGKDGKEPRKVELAQTALEKLAGRRARTALTLEDQAERFEFLKNAPVESFARGITNLKVQPVGKLVRNVRCLRCRQWGHETGDRECPMRDVNPHDVERQVREDPLSAFIGLAGGSGAPGSDAAAAPATVAAADDAAHGGILRPDEAVAAHPLALALPHNSDGVAAHAGSHGRLIAIPPAEVGWGGSAGGSGSVFAPAAALPVSESRWGVAASRDLAPDAEVSGAGSSGHRPHRHRHKHHAHHHHHHHGRDRSSPSPRDEDEEKARAKERLPRNATSRCRPSSRSRSPLLARDDDIRERHNERSHAGSLPASRHGGSGWDARDRRDEDRRSGGRPGWDRGREDWPRGRG